MPYAVSNGGMRDKLLGQVDFRATPGTVCYASALFAPGLDSHDFKTMNKKQRD